MLSFMKARESLIASHHIISPSNYRRHPQPHQRKQPFTFRATAAKHPSSMPPTYRTSLTVPSTLPTLDAQNIRLMPFHLAYTGSAEVDVYLQPRVAEGCADTQRDTPRGQGREGVTGRVAAFRGRQVVEHLVLVPTGYTGCVVRAPARPTGMTEDVVLPMASKVDPAEESVAEGRALRKRKVAPVAAKSRTRRKVVPAKRFTLDSEEEEEEEDAADAERGAAVDVEQEEGKIDVEPELGIGKEEEPAREVPKPLEHTDSMAVVDTMITLPDTLLDSPQPSQPSQPQDDVPTDGLPFSTPNDTDSWIHERRLVPEATFSAFSIWTADEPMYSVSTEEGEEARDVRRMMGERDEYVRALDEGMRVGGVLHAW